MEHLMGVDDGVDPSLLWQNMLAVQRAFGCYNSARMRAAVEMGGDEGLMPSKACLDLLNDSISRLPEDARRQTLSPASAHKLHGLDTLAHFLHVFNTHYNSEDSVTHHGVVHPHFDLAENNTLYAIYGELAGLSKKDVTVEVNDGLFTITISGKLLRLAPPGSLGLSINEPTPDTVGVVHKDESNAGAQTDRAAVEGEKAEEGGKKQQQQQQQQEDDLQWHVTERKVGSFRRAFQFPAQSVDMQGVNATMTNGLLCVTVPKKERKGEEEKGRKVEVS
ncbi:hypothetical protein DL546_007476 [Coniochaeta pulveracea]|uniref:SHSP domain-containing protein n=1 Tax=Coniochaeta pulveracea TaxID=177199 RepID=A0A420YA90_9PEZI|nr:hypothetical protein DL546_007476 [Coniochaeta pulveracea]